MLRQASPIHREEREQSVPLEEDVGYLGHPEEENNIYLPEEEDLEIMRDPPSAEPPVFALTPAQASPVNVIDCATSIGVKAHNADTAELVHKFDGESKNSCIFLRKN